MVRLSRFVTSAFDFVSMMHGSSLLVPMRSFVGEIRLRPQVGQVAPFILVIESGLKVRYVLL